MIVTLGPELPIRRSCREGGGGVSGTTVSWVSGKLPLDALLITLGVVGLSGSALTSGVAEGRMGGPIEDSDLSAGVRAGVVRLPDFVSFLLGTRSGVFR